MPLTSITLKDFSGGLNTAVDPSRLPANMTASMQNCDILDSRAITRRNGYSRLTASVVASAKVEAVTRFYKTDASKHWVAVCGTAMYSKQSAVTDVSPTLLEAESATRVGGTVVYDAAYSGGAAVNCTTGTAVSFSLPYSTRVDVVFPQGALCGSYKTDGGSYASINATTVSIGGLAATSHTVYIKPPVRNTSACKLTVATGAVLLATSTTAGNTYTVKFYDDMSTTVDKNYVTFDDGAATSPVGLGVGVNCNQSTTHYYMEAPALSQSQVLPVARSAGWHTVTFFGIGNRANVVIDGVPYSRISTNTTAPLLGLLLADGSAQSSWFDSVTKDGKLLDDFTNLNGWRVMVDTGTNTYTTSSTHYDNIPIPTAVDSFTRSAIASWTKKDTTLSATTDTWGFATLGDKLYYNSPYDNLRKYDGGTAAAVYANGVSGTLAPAGGYLIEHKQRLFTAGKATDKSLIEYTAVGAPENWAGGGAIRLEGQASGGGCTGLAEFSDKLFYFSYDKTYILDCTGADTNWIARTLSDNIGCIAPKTLCRHGNALIFLAGDGVRAYGYLPGINSPDGSAFLTLSDDIAPTIASIVNKGNAVATVYKDKLWLACSLSGSANDTILVYRFPRDGLPGSWVKYTGIGIDSMTVTRGDEYALYGGSNVTGHIYQLDNGDTDDGAAIAMAYRVPQVSDKGYSTIKHFRRIILAAESPAVQAITVTPLTDDTAYDATTVTLDSSTDTRPVRVPLNSRGRSLGLDITSSGEGQPLTIHEVTLVHTGARMR